jgi:hypothetical protein
LTKERATVSYIISQFPEYKWVYNRQIYDGVSGMKPDLLLDMGDFLIIVEVDEHQHKKYGLPCEENRMHDILIDNKLRPTIFIRFNTDDYIDKNNNKIKSPWIYYRQTIKIGDGEYDLEWNHRLNILCEQIKHCIENKTDKLIEVIQLFYDEV